MDKCPQLLFIRTRKMKIIFKMTLNSKFEKQNMQYLKSKTKELVRNNPLILLGIPKY
jgi:hypothetical protein